MAQFDVQKSYCVTKILPGPQSMGKVPNGQKDDDMRVADNPEPATSTKLFVSSCESGVDRVRASSFDRGLGRQHREREIIFTSATSAAGRDARQYFVFLGSSYIVSRFTQLQSSGSRVIVALLQQRPTGAARVNVDHFRLLP